MRDEDFVPFADITRCSAISDESSLTKSDHNCSMKNNYTNYAKVAAHLLVLTVLACGVDDIGDRRLGDYVWYAVIGGIDPFGGSPPLRIILDSIGAGLCGGLACGIYGRLTLLKHRYVLYLIAYTVLSAAKVAYFARTWQSLSFGIEFWVNELALLLLAAAVAIIVGEWLVHFEKKWGLALFNLAIK